MGIEMTNTELRDSIAKELFVFTMQCADTPVETNIKFIAQVCFNSADAFMEEKLRREDRHYLGKVNDEEKS